jgi:[acyl-carrier-protein] S-malonyltransferase
MLEKIAGLGRPASDVLTEASELLGRDLQTHYRADNPAAYARNVDVQLGVFLANHMFLRMLEAAEIRAVASLGLSLGEWNHLVHIGAVSFRSALQAVEARGLAYDAGPRGAMASVFPIGVGELSELVARVQGKGVLEIVNLNSPRQQVLSGETAAIEEAMRLLDEEGLAQAVVIEQQVPMHCSIFKPVGDRFRSHLEQVLFRQPTLPYLPNRTAELLEAPSPAELVDLLSTHVHHPVLWARSIDLVVSRWPDPMLVEVGPKSVLYNLIDRKWHPGIRKACTDSSKDTEAHLAELIKKLRG